MKTILIATGNSHKIQEFKEIFEVLNVKANLVSPKDLGEYSEPIEDGKTYTENSIIKAKYYYDMYHLPTLADDSGIEIDFYDGKPGIYSARFLSDLSYVDKNNHIVNEMKNSDNRGARFKCYVTYIENDIIKTYEGTVEGTIAYKPEGEAGFGYDPIFIPKGETKTNAELGQDYKNRFCHRAIALKKWAKEYEE